MDKNKTSAIDLLIRQGANLTIEFDLTLSDEHSSRYIAKIEKGEMWFHSSYTSCAGSALSELEEFIVKETLRTAFEEL